MKQKYPLISVIVPVYNAEKYIEQCLESIYNQTYKNIEVIMVNDGSSDGSKAICQKYAGADKRFTLIDQINQGASIARNKGLLNAQGEYIAFVDADDWLEKDFYEVMYLSLVQNNADMAVCDFCVDNKLFNKWESAIIEYDKIFEEYLDGKIMNRLFNKLYKKEIIHNVFFPEYRDLMEDGVFMVKVLAKTNKVIRLDKGLYHYRVVSTSLMHNKKKSEEVMLGYFANILERLSLLFVLCPNRREVLFDDFLRQAKNILVSGFDLNKYEVYQTIQREISNYIKELKIQYRFDAANLWFINQIEENNNWVVMRNKYIRKCIFSNCFTLKEKIKAIIAIINNC